MICKNLEIIWEKIDKAANKIGKSKDDITLVAVSKTFPVDKIIEAYECGQKIFGENRVQEALKKVEVLKDRYPDIKFHLIGHLQSNKARYLKNNFTLIHSVDRIEIAELINKYAKKNNLVQDILIQVNLAEEPQKSGVLLNDFDKLMETVLSCENLKLRGLMMIPPLVEDAEMNRPLFAKMYELFVKTNDKYNINMDYLSMGMSDDFEIAIEEGANMVRIGSAIFGKRG
ncbi:YggS family pyridoxal phosphate-dependent enzyme [Deferribacter thermophilus]|uniref:YggS family pyridoxal phosphate-dependent enzyme n=1 Tax=Deferribacter thermophilus TaxID=53573 RepID=UPI003C221115